MTVPAVSVIIPTYNNAHFVGQTIQCVLDQTFQNFEVIVVDDGSTDNTKGVISSFKDKRIFYHYQERSGLPAVSRNTGIKLSQAGMIAFLDSDDKWYPEKLSKTMEVFFNNKDIDLVCHDEYVTLADKIIRKSVYGPGVEDMYQALLYRGNCLSTSAVVVKKEKLYQVGLFDERKDFFSVEDYDLWLRLAANGCKFYFLHEFLGEYVLHETNISANLEMNYNNLLNVLDVHFRKLATEHNFKIFNALKRKLKVRIAMVRDLVKSGQFNKAIYYFLKLPRELINDYQEYKILFPQG